MLKPEGKSGPRRRLSVLMPDNSRLIRDFDFHDGIVIEDDTLAGQAGAEPGVDRPIYKIFFLIGYFFQIVFPLMYIYMAGTTGTDPPTVVVEVDIVGLGNLEQGSPRLDMSDNNRLVYGFIFEYELNSGHGCFFAANVILKRFPNKKPPFWFSVVAF